MLKNSFNTSFLEVINNPLFPELDNQLRSGRHICEDDIGLYEFLHDKYDQLEQFYRAYSVELICDPEYYYFLRTKSTSIIPSSTLTEIEMLCGKALASLYMNPDRLLQEAYFSMTDVCEELYAHIPKERLIKLINPRATGTDLDTIKLHEKIQSALNRLARMGIIAFPKDNGRNRNRFKVRKTCLRFGIDVRRSDDHSLAIQQLVQNGDVVTPESLKLEEQALKALQQTQEEKENSLSNSKTSAPELVKSSTPENQDLSKIEESKDKSTKEASEEATLTQRAQDQNKSSSPVAAGETSQVSHDNSSNTTTPTNKSTQLEEKKVVGLFAGEIKGPTHTYTKQEAKAVRDHLYGIKGPSTMLIADGEKDDGSLAKSWAEYNAEEADNDVIGPDDFEQDQASQFNFQNLGARKFATKGLLLDKDDNQEDYDLDEADKLPSQIILTHQESPLPDDDGFYYEDDEQDEDEDGYDEEDLDDDDKDDN